jgi:hypothetical protein
MYLIGVSRNTALSGKNNLMNEFVTNHMYLHIPYVLINNQSSDYRLLTYDIVLNANLLLKKGCKMIHHCNMWKRYSSRFIVSKDTVEI